MDMTCSSPALGNNRVVVVIDARSQALSSSTGWNRENATTIVVQDKKENDVDPLSKIIPPLDDTTDVALRAIGGGRDWTIWTPDAATRKSEDYEMTSVVLADNPSGA
eukprot:GHVU01056513.1.p2 GENE.GHVU01056513.1~~GHVU01056513.1.p2  ORF type:complete len:107 (+),score=11.37 GHVU01056513.1:790-1110(+)